MQFHPEPYCRAKSKQDQGGHFRFCALRKFHDYAILCFAKNESPERGKEKPSRLGGGRRRDGYNLRIWMGASAGRFCNKPGLGVQPLLFNGIHLRWICEIFPNSG